MVKAKDIGLVKGFKISDNGKVISHLQFADDAICFSLATIEDVTSLKRVLR